MGRRVVLAQPTAARIVPGRQDQMKIRHSPGVSSMRLISRRTFCPVSRAVMRACVGRFAMKNRSLRGFFLVVKSVFVPEITATYAAYGSPMDRGRETVITSPPSFGSRRGSVRGARCRDQLRHASRLAKGRSGYYAVGRSCGPLHLDVRGRRDWASEVVVDAPYLAIGGKKPCRAEIRPSIGASHAAVSGGCPAYFARHGRMRATPSFSTAHVDPPVWRKNLKSARFDCQSKRHIFCVRHFDLLIARSHLDRDAIVYHDYHDIQDNYFYRVKS